MHHDPSAQTSPTLLGRLRDNPSDETAWNLFVQRYGPCIERWCRGWQLQEADAQDVTQNVLLRLSEKLRSFEYDPDKSFRAWLKTLSHHVWRDFLDAKRRPGVGSGDTNVVQLLHSVEARDDLAQKLEEEYDRDLLDRAIEIVQPRVAENTWEAFRLLVFEGLSGAEAAERTGMQVSMVFVAKSRVQKMLQQEIERLEGPKQDG